MRPQSVLDRHQLATDGVEPVDAAGEGFGRRRHLLHIPGKIDRPEPAQVRDEQALQRREISQAIRISEHLRRHERAPLAAFCQQPHPATLRVGYGDCAARQQCNVVAQRACIRHAEALDGARLQGDTQELRIRRTLVRPRRARPHDLAAGVVANAEHAAGRLGLAPHYCRRTGLLDAMQTAVGHRPCDPAVLEDVDAFGVQIGVGADEPRDFPGGLAVARRAGPQRFDIALGGERRERTSIPERVVIAVARQPSQFRQRLLRLAGRSERLGVQEAQRRVRRRPLGQLLRSFQEPLEVALLARRDSLLIERQRIGQCRGCTTKE